MKLSQHNWWDLSNAFTVLEQIENYIEVHHVLHIDTWNKLSKHICISARERLKDKPQSYETLIQYLNRIHEDNTIVLDTPTFSPNQYIPTYSNKIDNRSLVYTEEIFPSEFAQSIHQHLKDSLSTREIGGNNLGAQYAAILYSLQIAYLAIGEGITAELCDSKAYMEVSKCSTTKSIEHTDHSVSSTLANRFSLVAGLQVKPHGLERVQILHKWSQQKYLDTAARWQGGTKTKATAAAMLHYLQHKGSISLPPYHNADQWAEILNTIWPRLEISSRTANNCMTYNDARAPRVYTDAIIDLGTKV